MPSCAAWVEISLISTVWDLKKVFALLAKLLELHRFNQHYQASVHFPLTSALDNSQQHQVNERELRKSSLGQLNEKC